MAIKLDYTPASDPLFAQSKLWGFPDMPEELDWPEVPVNDDGDEYDDPLTFICQIRCSEIAALDPDGLLPHDGMLYFFGALDYFLGNPDAPLSPGLGEWEKPFFRVLYSPSCENLHTHSLLYDDGSPACIRAHKLEFSKVGTEADGFKLLGVPFYEETRLENPACFSLLQLDEEDDWELRFFDCGILNFLISPVDLAARRWSAVRCWLHSA